MLPITPWAAGGPVELGIGSSSLLPCASMRASGLDNLAIKAWNMASKRANLESVTENREWLASLSDPSAPM